MQFRLIYKGPLASNGDAADKQAIRKKLHPQLRELWRTDPHLAQWTQSRVVSRQFVPMEGVTTELEKIAANHCMGPYRFVPLVARDIGLVCSLDILFLRREEPGRLVSQGDIDNRIKTLFDGLRRPNTMSEAANQSPDESEVPFFVLLEDDRLIVELRVETDRLLIPKGTLEPPDDVELVITVRTRIVDYRNAYLDMGF